MAARAPDPQLVREVVARGVVCAGAEWTALDGGRTNHVWHVGRGASAIVVKLYATAANPLFPNDPEAEALALRSVSGRNLGPDLLDVFLSAKGPCLIYHHIEAAARPEDPDALFALLSRVHHCPAPAGLRVVAGGSAQIATQVDAMLSADTSVEAAVLRALRPGGTVPPCDRRCLLHGDPVPGNVVWHAAGPQLIDWQCPAQGDPCEDLGLALSPAMRLAYGAAPLTSAQQDRALATYAAPQVAARLARLRPWFHWRMAAYCLWRLARGDAGARAGFLAEHAALEACGNRGAE